jgi:hypothetical protein
MTNNQDCLERNRIEKDSHRWTFCISASDALRPSATAHDIFRKPKSCPFDRSTKCSEDLLNPPIPWQAMSVQTAWPASGHSPLSGQFGISSSHQHRQILFHFNVLNSRGTPLQNLALIARFSCDDLRFTLNHLTLQPRCSALWFEFKASEKALKKPSHWAGISMFRWFSFWIVAKCASV